MDDSAIKKLVKRLRQSERKEVKILIFASYQDIGGRDTIDSRLQDIKEYLSENLYFKTDIFLASDKRLGGRKTKEHVLHHAKESDIVLIIAFKDAAGMTLGAELDRILEEDEFVQKSILCADASIEIGDWFTDQPNYRRIARVSFKDFESLKKKLLHRILGKKRELLKKIIDDTRKLPR